MSKDNLRIAGSPDRSTIFQRLYTDGSRIRNEMNTAATEAGYNVQDAASVPQESLDPNVLSQIRQKFGHINLGSFGAPNMMINLAELNPGGGGAMGWMMDPAQLQAHFHSILPPEGFNRLARPGQKHYQNLGPNDGIPRQWDKRWGNKKLGGSGWKVGRKGCFNTTLIDAADETDVAGWTERFSRAGVFGNGANMDSETASGEMGWNITERHSKWTQNLNADVSAAKAHLEQNSTKPGAPHTHSIIVEMTYINKKSGHFACVKDPKHIRTRDDGRLEMTIRDPNRGKVTLVENAEGYLTDTKGYGYKVVDIRHMTRKNISLQTEVANKRSVKKG